MNSFITKTYESYWKNITMFFVIIKNQHKILDIHRLSKLIIRALKVDWSCLLSDALPFPAICFTFSSRFFFCALLFASLEICSLESWSSCIDSRRSLLVIAGWFARSYDISSPFPLLISHGFFQSLSEHLIHSEYIGARFRLQAGSLPFIRNLIPRLKQLPLLPTNRMRAGVSLRVSWVLADEFALVDCSLQE